MRFALLAWTFALAGTAAEIPQGVHVALHLVNSISTRTAKEGDYVYMRTASPIAAGGQIVVPVGTYVQGVVTSARRSGRVSGRAELSIRIETMTLASGKVIQISPHLASVDAERTTQTVKSENEIEQGPDHGTDAARVATLSGAGAAIGGLTERTWSGAGIGAGAGAGVGLATVLLTRGKEIDLRRGASVDVVFDRAVPIE